jgi:hypothetical protein
MPLTFADPAALWGLALIPIVWVIAMFGRRDFAPRQRMLQAAVRSIALALLVLALAQPLWSRPSSRSGIVFLVDVSHSIAPASITHAADRIDEITARLRPDAVRILAFGSRAERVADTQALRSLAAEQPGAGEDRIGRDASDLQRALAAARAELGPGDLPRLVLFSDGRETRGDVRNATLRLAAEGIPVFVEPLAVRDLGDVWVDGLQVPDAVPADTVVSLTALVGAQRAVRGATVDVRESGRVLESRTIDLIAGLNAVALDVTLATAGPHAVEL